MVCEGSNGQPQVTNDRGDAVWVRDITADDGKPLRIESTVALHEDYVACPHCRNGFKALKSGLVPKHTRYVSWKEQQEMKAAGIEFEKRSR